LAEVAEEHVECYYDYWDRREVEASEFKAWEGVECLFEVEVEVREEGVVLEELRESCEGGRKEGGKLEE
jgi:hypothetical protein